MKPPARPIRVRAIIFFLITVGAVLIALLHAPVPQDLRYHLLADTRRLLAIPNALNVLSNVGFAFVGAWGLLALRSVAFLDPRERYPWMVLFAGVALTCAGSAWYHLEPNNATLVWDRLPMTLGFMGLFAALVSERVSVRWGFGLLAPLVVLGAASVGYWAWKDNLVPYLVVQFYPLITIPLLLGLFPARYTRGEDLLLALGWYLAAKVAESYDGEVYQFLGAVSGHTLKHVLATVGAGWIVRMLVLRRAAPLVAARPAGAAEVDHLAGADGVSSGQARTT
jgi:hypothetical protein